MNRYVVVVNTDGVSKIVSISDDSEVIDYPHFCALKSLCDTPIDLWETVLLRDLFVAYDGIMLIAEDGKLRDLPPNLLATSLYGNPRDYIAGDVVIVGRAFDPEDLRYLTLAEAEFLLSEFSL